MCGLNAESILVFSAIVEISQPPAKIAKLDKQAKVNGIANGKATKAEQKKDQNQQQKKQKQQQPEQPQQKVIARQ